MIRAFRATMGVAAGLATVLVILVFLFVGGCAAVVSQMPERSETTGATGGTGSQR